MIKNILSIDLGTQNDYTAYSMLTHAQKLKERMQNQVVMTNEMHLRFLEREDLKTPYPKIIDRTCEIMNNPLIAGETALVIDCTGVGIAVLQQMREAGLSPIGITITGGRIVQETDFGYSVPKRDLIVALQCALQSSRLRIARGIGTEMIQAFRDEIEHFKVKKTKGGQDTYEGWRQRDHDDIVLSVAQNCWYFDMVFSRQSVLTPNFKDEEGYDPLGY